MPALMGHLARKQTLPFYTQGGRRGVWGSYLYMVMTGVPTVPHMEGQILKGEKDSKAKVFGGQ